MKGLMLGNKAPVQISANLGDDAIGTRLDKALADALPHISRERIKALLIAGHICDAKGDAVRDGKTRISAPLSLLITIPEARPAETAPQDIALDIAYEDADLIVVNKPAGLVVHPAAGNLDGTLVNALLHHCAGQLSGIGGVARPGIVHRIDKDTSGLIVAAKHDRAHEGLARQFAAHSIYRRYLAIVQGRPAPPNGTIHGNIGRSSANRKKMAVVGDPAGKHATTHYQSLEILRDSSLIQCILETGRTHQIRVHMAHIGHSLLGDPLYGRDRKGIAGILKAQQFHRQALHAADLGFEHPISGAEIRLSSEIPHDMARLATALRL
jgi:23S rRNA pseudouridine1911/1915/1917 synthase